MRKLSLYRIRIKDFNCFQMATSVGNAFRKAVRSFMAEGCFGRQPKSTPDGGWENTSVTLVKG